MDDTKKTSPSAPFATEATVPAARAHNAGDGGAVAGGPKRFSAKRKLAVVQRLLRGESLEVVCREENVPVHRLTEWRDKVLTGAESALRAGAMPDDTLTAVGQKLVGKLGDETRRLRLQRSREHLAGSLAGDLGQRVEDGSGLAERGDRGIVRHRRIVPLGSSGRLGHPPRYAAFSGPITHFLP